MYSTHPYLEVTIISKVSFKIQRDIINFLKENVDVFAWSHQDMVGIDLKPAWHHLKIDPKRKPISQKRRKFGLKKYTALSEKVKKLLDSKLIKQAKDEPQWVANAMLVKKSNES